MIKKTNTRRKPSSFSATELRKAGKKAGRREISFVQGMLESKLASESEVKKILQLRTPFEILMARNAFENKRIKFNYLKEALPAESKEEFLKAMGITAKTPAPFQR